MHLGYFSTTVSSLFLLGTMNPLHLLAFLFLFLKLIADLVVGFPEVLVLLTKILNFLDQVLYFCVIY